MQVNLIHLAMLSGRIPILPPYVPSSIHLGKSGNITNVSEFFDLPRLREELQWPILEWSDVKRARYGDLVNSPALEEVVKEPLGCWSFWMSNTGSEKASWYVSVSPYACQTSSSRPMLSRSSLPGFLNLGVLGLPSFPSWR